MWPPVFSKLLTTLPWIGSNNAAARLKTINNTYIYIYIYILVVVFTTAQELTKLHKYNYFFNTYIIAQSIMLDHRNFVWY